MRDLQSELDALDDADRHIAEGEVRIARMQAQVDEGRTCHGDVDAALLAASKGVLAAMREHRALIVETIADIRAGKL